MVNVMATFEGLNVEQLEVKFISMGYIDCSNVFDIARVQLGVITQMKKNVIPFMICPLNQSSDLGLIKAKFGGSFGSHPCALYGFLFHSPKYLWNFKGYVMCFQKKKKKLFTNVKTRWINMLILVKHVMKQYQPLSAKMHIDARKNNIVNDKLNLLCVLKLIFGFKCNWMPLLDYVHALIKLPQS